MLIGTLEKKAWGLQNTTKRGSRVVDYSAGGVAEDRAFIWYGIGRVYTQESCNSVGGQG